MAENKDESQQQSFEKILKDFLDDILTTFPELADDLNEHLNNVKNNLDPDLQSLNTIKDFCKKVFPEKFFDILYQNETIFLEDTPLFFLPGINFNKLWNDNISDKTKETIWKYLQLILFTIVSDISDTSSFGDTAKLFEAINEEELKTKLEETITNLQECFDCSSNNFNNSGINMDNIPDAEGLHQHVNSMLNGKLGSLAKEIAEETAQELDLDMEEGSNVNDIFKKLFKNPNKLMGLVQKVGGKLDEKIKSGDIKESELLAEASEMVKKMKDMPGMEHLQSMLGKMGKAGGKMDMNAMQSHLKRNMRLAKQKERMKSKVNDKNNVEEPVIDLKAVEKANQMAYELLQQEGLLNKNDVENLVFSTGEKYEQSVKPTTTGQTSKKKRGKKNRKGGK